MKVLRHIILFGTLLVFLYFVNTGIINSERNITEGTVAYFELRPRDPRSIIQGDYMVLNYAIEADAWQSEAQSQERGQLVLVLDENRIAHFDRLFVEGDTLAENEILVNYYTRDRWRISVGVDSFFFQEGQADDYNGAEYAEVRVLDGGGVMLINLTDENLQVIVPAD